ncbi:MAG: hypothetical protein ACI9Y7_003083, partial [Dokdonia sp.]
TRFLFLLLLSTVVFSQETPIVLEGSVLNDSIEKASLSVVNLNLRKGAITNEAGVFEIPVRVSDTIHISAVQYESRQFVVTQKMYDLKKMSLYLVPKINELDEVNINNKFLSGVLDKDANDMSLKELLDGIQKAADQGLFEDVEIPTQEERKLHTATTGTDGRAMVNFTGFVVPLPWLINGISGKTKKLKKHIAVATYQDKVTQTITRYPDSLYIKEFQIPKVLIEDFMFYALQDEHLDSIAIENSLLFLDFLKVKATLYLDLRKKEESSNNEKE